MEAGYYYRKHKRHADVLTNKSLVEGQNKRKAEKPKYDKDVQRPDQTNSERALPDHAQLELMTNHRREIKS